MSDKTCDCSVVSLGNTGEPGCVIVADIISTLILDTAVDSTGAAKERTLADMKSFATLEPMLNAVDGRDRLYPIINLENVENLRDDAVFFDFNSGKRSFVRDGFKNFTGVIENAPRELVDKLNKNKCINLGAWALDDSNQLIYKKGSTSALGAPILIDKNTFHAKYVEATNDAPAWIMVSFQWKKSEADSEIKVIPAADLDYDSEDLYGLLDADSLYTLISTAGFTATITETCYGNAVEGLLLADFTLTEISPTPGDITSNIASVTESAPGVYDFVFTVAEGSGDVLRLSALKNRYDFSAMSDGTNDITIP